MAFQCAVPVVYYSVPLISADEFTGESDAPKKVFSSDARINVAVAIDEWHNKFPHTNFAKNGETIEGFSSAVLRAKELAAKQLAEQTARETAARKAQEAQEKAEAAAENARLLAAANAMSLAEQEARRKADMYHERLEERKAAASRIVDSVQNQAKQTEAARRERFGLNGYGYEVWQSSISEHLAEGGSNLPSRVIFASIWDVDDKFSWLPGEVAAAILVSRCEGQPPPIIAIHCNVSQIGAVMAQLSPLAPVWDIPYMIGASMSSLTLECLHSGGLERDDKKKLHAFHKRADTVAGLYHSVILTCFQSVAQMSLLRTEMIDGFANLGSANCMRLRRLFPGHPSTGGEYGPGYYEPYSFRANLSTEPKWYGDDEFPLHWAIANYLRWRTTTAAPPQHPFVLYIC